MSTALLICGTIAFMGILGGYIYLMHFGKDVDKYLVFILAVAALIPGTAAWKKGVEIQKDQEVIKNQTNGPLTATHENVARIHERVITDSDRISMVETSINNRMDKLEGLLNQVIAQTAGGNEIK
jgi:hypothetical protein